MITNSDDELKLRIKEGFNAEPSDRKRPRNKKILERPKTPHTIKKRKKEIMDDLSENMKNVSLSSDNKKPNSISKPQSGNTTSKEVYLCHKCDKKYKSKFGIRKHLTQCSV